jgi:hypothetical protein
MSRVPYSLAVGSLMYAMVCTRPDIAHAVGVVSMYMNNTGKEHWEAVKWILGYLRGTMMQEHRQHIKQASAEEEDNWTSASTNFEIYLEIVART